MKQLHATRKGQGRHPQRVSNEQWKYNYYAKALRDSKAEPEVIIQTLGPKPFVGVAGAKIARAARNQTIGKRH